MANQLPLVGVRSIVENFSPFQRQMQIVNDSLRESGKAARDAADQAAKGANRWTELASKMSVIGTVARGVIDAFKSVIDFAERGSRFESIANAFNNTTAATGLLANELLTKLRTASGHTISDFELMRQANIALAGSTGEFGKQFGQNLPKLLEIARVQAKATGTDIDFLFQSLVTGIKRSSPLMIDNTGLVLKIGAANEAYAQSIGKTVQELTAEELQIAVLNATLEAGNTALAAAGEQQDTVADKVARAGATITNIFDTISATLQPIFGRIFDIINTVLIAIGNFVSAAAPYLAAIGQIIGSVLQLVENAFGSLFEGIDWGMAAKDFFTGAANVVGQLANGMLMAANTLVLPAITAIANLIADFLMAFSPVRKGPLHNMAQGGQNLMGELITGMLGGVQGVGEVAAEVDAMLGNIGRMSRPAIEMRLAQLDRALLPFQDRLKIVSDEFDALKEPAEAAIRAVDRQIEQAQEALMRGDAGAAERIRALDAQREAIQGAVDAQQSLVDRSQIQLGLARAMQASERARLQVALGHLPVAQQIAAASEAAAATGAGPKAPTGAAAPPPTPAATPMPNMPQIDPVSIFGTESEVAAAGQLLTDSFLAPIEASGSWQDFQAKSGDLNTALGRIGEGASKWGDRFKEMGDSVQTALGPLVSWFTDTSVSGGLAWAINAITTDLPGWLAGIGPSIQTNLIDPIVNLIKIPVQWLYDAVFEGGLANAFSSLGGSIGTWLSGIPATLQEHLVTPISNIATSIFDWIANSTYPGGFANTMSNIVTNISTWLSGVGDKIQERLVDPIAAKIAEGVSWLTNPDHEGGLANAFSTIGDRLATWVKDIGASLQTGIIDPIAAKVGDAWNWLVNPDHEGGLANAIFNLPTKIGEWLGSLGSKLNEFIVLPFIFMVTDIWAWLTDPDQEGGLANAIVNLPTRIGEWLAGLGDTLTEFVIQPFINMASDIWDWIANPEHPGGLANAFNGVITLLQNIWTNVQPFLEAFRDGIKAIFDWIVEHTIAPFLRVLDGIRNTLKDMAGAAGFDPGGGQSEQFQSRSSVYAPSRMGGATGGIFGPTTGAALGGIFRGFPGAAVGGGFGLRVGERGEEFVSSAQKLAVFPNEFVVALDRLTNVMTQVMATPAPLPLPATSSSDDHSMTNIFNGVSGGEDVQRRMAMLRARR